MLRFDDRRAPRSLRDLPLVDVAAPADLDPVISSASRVLVLGGDAELAMVLSRLLRQDLLDVEVAPAPNARLARRARDGESKRVPLIRDETGRALVGTAFWLPPDGSALIEGEAIVDDTVLFDGHARSVRVQATGQLPGLRAQVVSGRLGSPRWVTGRAAQLGTTGAIVVRDGKPVANPVKRSTFYRNTRGWLRVS
ncbi:hypothetical protein MBRU_04125 [Mycolicibacterium brumae DSM 44177]|nr:hypothetical protein MBRU_04125 [Mycolicibacterium brumae DSM 44177]